jgi:parallel beta-helix repeat protein
MGVRVPLLLTLTVAALLAGSGCTVSIGDSSEPSPTPTDAAVVVLPPTSDAAVFQDALLKVPYGGTLKLEAGTYLVERRLTIEQSVHLVGAGRGRTEIESTAAKAGIVVTAPSFGAEGISFRHSGSSAGGVVKTEDCELRIVDCSFAGATARRGWWYEALWLRGACSGYVRDCAFEDSAMGIGLSDRARTSVEQCRFSSCGRAGIGIYGSAQPAIRRNVCTNCDDVGIFAFGSARPLLQSNRCTRNEYGIACAQHARVRLEENRCSSNLDSGIIAYDQASATLVGNVCIGNRENGIAMTEGAAVRISGNTVEHNKGVGIGCWGRVSGRISGNDVTRNGTGQSGGICLGDHANLLVADNRCEYNRQYGILFRDSATGTARGNHCAHSHYGILDNSSRAPTLAGNDLEWNSEQDIGRW